MFCYEWDLFGETSAAWIQAIGSLIGIGIAIWVPIWHASITERRTVLALIDGLIAMAKRAIPMIDAAKNLIDGDADDLKSFVQFEFESADLRRVIEDFRRLQFETLKDHRLVAPTRDLPDAISIFVTAFETLKSDFDVYIDPRIDWETDLKYAWEETHRCLRAFAAVRQDYC